MKESEAQVLVMAAVVLESGRGLHTPCHQHVGVLIVAKVGPDLGSCPSGYATSTRAQLVGFAEC